MLHCWADGKGGQKIENTGALTKKRMETIDDEFLAGHAGDAGLDDLQIVVEATLLGADVIDGPPRPNEVLIQLGARLHQLRDPRGLFG